MRNKIILFLISLISAEILSASTLLKIPSAKLSTGEILALKGDSPSVIQFNPASIDLEDYSIEASMQKGFMGDDSLYYLGYSRAFSNSIIGVFFNHYTAGTLEYFDRYGNKRSVNAQVDYILGGHYKRRHNKKISYGVNLKYFTSTLIEYADASAVAADIGFDYREGYGMMGLTIKNIGFPIDHYDSAESLPLTLLGGLGYMEGKYFAGLAASYNFSEKIFSPHIAAEIKLVDMLYLRGGYKFGSAVESFSLGFGIDILSRGIKVAYNFGLSKTFDNTHFITISFSPH